MKKVIISSLCTTLALGQFLLAKIDIDVKEMIKPSVVSDVQYSSYDTNAVTEEVDDFVDITNYGKMLTMSNIEHLKAVLDICQDNRYLVSELDKRGNYLEHKMNPSVKPEELAQLVTGVYGNSNSTSNSIECANEHDYKFGRFRLSKICADTTFKAVNLSMVANNVKPTRSDITVDPIFMLGVKPFGLVECNFRGDAVHYRYEPSKCIKAGTNVREYITKTFIGLAPYRLYSNAAASLVFDNVIGNVDGCEIMKRDLYDKNQATMRALTKAVTVDAKSTYKLAFGTDDEEKCGYNFNNEFMLYKDMDDIVLSFAIENLPNVGLEETKKTVSILTGMSGEYDFRDALISHLDVDHNDATGQAIENRFNVLTRDVRAATVYGSHKPLRYHVANRYTTPINFTEVDSSTLNHHSNMLRTKYGIWSNDMAKYMADGMIKEELLLVPSIEEHFVDDKSITIKDGSNSSIDPEPMCNLDEGLYVFTTNTSKNVNTYTKLAYKDKHGRISNVRNILLNRSINFYYSKYKSKFVYPKSKNLLSRVKHRILDEVKNNLYMIEFKRINFEYGSNNVCTLVDHYKKHGFTHCGFDNKLVAIEDLYDIAIDRMNSHRYESVNNVLNDVTSTIDPKLVYQLDQDANIVNSTMSIVFYRVKVISLHDLDNELDVYYDRDFNISLSHVSNIQDLYKFNLDCNTKQSQLSFEYISNSKTKRLFISMGNYVMEITSKKNLRLDDGLYVVKDGVHSMIDPTTYEQHGIFRNRQSAKEFNDLQPSLMASIERHVELAKATMELDGKNLKQRETEFKLKIAELKTKGNDIIHSIDTAISDLKSTLEKYKYATDDKGRVLDTFKTIKELVRLCMW